MNKIDELKQENLNLSTMRYFYLRDIKDNVSGVILCQKKMIKNNGKIFKLFLIKALNRKTDSV